MTKLVTTKYSAVIRTIGQNDLLNKTLLSLEKQTFPPDEIVIVIPQDVSPWKVDNKKIRFVHAERGMISQRAQGIINAVNSNILLLDDDVILDSNAALKIFEALNKHDADCISPYWAEAYPKGIKRYLYAFWGIAIPKKKGGITYTAGGGFFYPTKDPGPEVWETTGGIGQVIAINRDFVIANGALGDMDLQRIKYALRDDGAFILKIVQCGGRCLMISGVDWVHLGGNSRLSSDRFYQVYKASIYNNYIFWKKYIKPEYNQSLVRRLRSNISILWHLIGVFCLSILSTMRLKNLSPLKGIIDGIKSIKLFNVKQKPI